MRVVLRSAGAATETVTVRPGVVASDSAASTTEIDAGSIETLPIVGRSYQSYTTLAPGVTDPDLDGNPNVEGSRETGMQYRLDGEDVTDPGSGTFGKNLNFDTIEQLQVITTGADAAYGRADGGFTNIVTRSGGNNLQGRVRLLYRGGFLDGEKGTIYGTKSDSQSFEPSFTLGGPFVKDRLWYFGSVRWLDRRTAETDGEETNRSVGNGWDVLAKVTWQPRLDDKLSFQIDADPRRYTNLSPGPSESPDAGYDWHQGGLSWEAGWTHAARPDLFVHAGIGGFDSGISTDPASSLYNEFKAPIVPSFTGFGTRLQTLYPTRECSNDGTAAGFVPNCDPALGRVSLYRLDLASGEATGPSWFEVRDDRKRVSFGSDVTWSPAPAAGEHLVTGGVEYTREKFEDTSHYNPVLQDATLPCPSCRVGGIPIPNAVTGYQVLSVPLVPDADQRSTADNTGLYASETWKPWPNLALSAGLRLDVERIDASGFAPFDPASEKRRSMGILEGLCAEGFRVLALGYSNTNVTTACDPASGYSPYFGPPTVLRFPIIQTTPQWIKNFDANRDALFDSGVDRLPDGRVAWQKPVTTFAGLEAEPFSLRNDNLSPRFGIAWDPWSDGRTRLFGSWGRYYDRIYPGAAARETSTTYMNFVFTPDPSAHVFLPGQSSLLLNGPSLNQIDRNLRTPRTDVFSLGVERELGPEWSGKLTYVQRLASDLQQDADVNHATCIGLKPLLGIDPASVCTQAVLPGGQVVLGKDLFGSPVNGPNGLTDLYVLDSSFNQILRVDSSDSATYRGVTVELSRRRYRNWSLTAAYTYSRATGGGASAYSVVGDDPAMPVRSAILAFDQRHRVLVYGTAGLPHHVDFGWDLQYESGLPYSFTTTTVDMDNIGSVTNRLAYPLGGRNT
ncbi:MAG TPA: TonB-dependent receptor, partial [Candidatus Saccharimonadales bacterium]|nr:TonB-dependent receptor [Candidatus Saccharimonadales bacterium]